uniref:hypothetical protein n=1 Tax=Candidatus Electronema sp. TaxID=2698783 RepID=UPI0040562059
MAKNGWPFNAHGKRRAIYDPAALPASCELMNRTLVYQISVKLEESRRRCKRRRFQAGQKERGRPAVCPFPFFRFCPSP